MKRARIALHIEADGTRYYQPWASSIKTGGWEGRCHRTMYGARMAARRRGW